MSFTVRWVVFIKKKNFFLNIVFERKKSEIMFNHNAQANSAINMLSLCIIKLILLLLIPPLMPFTLLVNGI